MSERKGGMLRSLTACGVSAALLSVSLSAYAQDTSTLDVNPTPAGQRPGAPAVAAAAPAENPVVPKAAPPAAKRPDAGPIPVPDQDVRANTVVHRGGGVIEEIIVTSQKREENIQSVPIAITAFSGDQLEKLGVQSTQDLGLHTPGLIFDTVANFAVIYLRGVGTDAFLPSADTSVATYIDGVYFPNSYSLARSLGALQRIEILKGPQGTLFGRNATGGAINVITRDPSEEFTASAYAALGNFDDYESKVYLSGPIIPTLSASLGLVYNFQDSYYKLTKASPLSQLDPAINRGANLKLKWKPWDWFDATASGFAINSSGTGTSLLPALQVTTLGASLGVNNAANPTQYETSVNDQPTAYSQQYVGSLSFNAHPGPLDIKSITAYQQLNVQALQDFDGSNVDLVSFGTPSDLRHQYPKELFSRYFTQEVQFLSNDQSPFADQLKLIGGFYFLRGTVGFDPLFFNVSGLADLADPVLGGLPLLGNFPFLNNIVGKFGGLIDDLSLTSAGLRPAVNGALDTTSYAGFFQETWTPVHSLGVTLGGRVTSETRRVYNASLGADLTLGDQTYSIQTLAYAPQSFNAFTYSPKVSFDVHPADDILLYASWQRAFKSGSFNIVNLTAPPTYIKPERVDAYELGLKSEFLDRSVRLNAAIFQSKIHDLQSQFVSLTSGGVVQFENANLGTVKGGEFDVLWAATASLRLSFAATYLHGIYNSFPNASGYSQVQTNGMISGQSGSSFDFSGNTIVRNPRFSGTAGVNYTTEAPGGSVQLEADDYYNSGYFYDAQNSLRQNAFSLAGAHASYTYDPLKTTMTLFGANLGDTKHFVYKTQFNFDEAGLLAPPLTYGLRVNWSF